MHVHACMQAADGEAGLTAACCERDALRLRMSGLEEEFVKAAAEAAAAQAETVQLRAAAAAAAAEARAAPSLTSNIMACHLLPPTVCCSYNTTCASK